MVDTARKLMMVYEPGVNRVITPENVYQPAVTQGREHVVDMMNKLLLPGSCFEGHENLEHCLGELEAGRTVLFLPEHRGNMDAYSIDILLGREDPKFRPILDRIIFIAGRKLNEASDLVKAFSEKYSRLIIVPRRDYPPVRENETEEERKVRESFEAYAARINRAAFRQLILLRRKGHIFILYPLGGRLKPGADNTPVPETVSYMERFDTAYPISMEGNVLPPLAKMEDDRPVQDKVIFRVGRPLATQRFLASMRARYEDGLIHGDPGETIPFEQYTVEHIMKILERLRLTGHYGDLAVE